MTSEMPAIRNDETMTSVGALVKKGYLDILIEAMQLKVKVEVKVEVKVSEG